MVNRASVEDGPEARQMVDPVLGRFMREVNRAGVATIVVDIAEDKGWAHHAGIIVRPIPDAAGPGEDECGYVITQYGVLHGIFWDRTGYYAEGKPIDTYDPNNYDLVEAILGTAEDQLASGAHGYMVWTGQRPPDSSPPPAPVEPKPLPINVLAPGRKSTHNFNVDDVTTSPDLLGGKDATVYPLRKMSPQRPPHIPTTAA